MRGGVALRRGSAPRPAHVRPRHQAAVADRWPLAHGAEREPAQGWVGVRVGLGLGSGLGSALELGLGLD